jgi:hypothetical protein
MCSICPRQPCKMNTYYLLASLLTLASSTSTPFDYAQMKALCDAGRGVPGAVYTCSDSQFLGDCVWMPKNPSQCYSWAAEDQRPHSIGPDAGGHCKFYVEANCEGATAHMPDSDVGVT